MILPLSPSRKKVKKGTRRSRKYRRKRINKKEGSRRGWNVDGGRLATLGREYTRISHNFPQKFPALRAGIVQLKFIFEHQAQRLGFPHLRTELVSFLPRLVSRSSPFRFVSFHSLIHSLSLPLSLFCSCPSFLLRRLYRPRLKR